MGIFWLIVAILGVLVAIFGVIGLFVAEQKGGPWAVIIAGVIVALVAGFFSMTFTNDEGQAKVLRSWTGEVQGEVTTPGLGTKAPWQSALTYNIRNEQVIFAGDGTGDKVNAPQVTVQDREGVSANIDISVRYSIRPDSVADVYKQYGSQEDFVAKFIENDIRAGVRTIPAQYGTLDLLTSRAEIETKITDYLEERWVDSGVRVDTVSLQEIRYPEDVQQRFAEAQNARTEVEKANADLEANKVKAESNRVLAESLTDQNLEQLKYEALQNIGKNGNLIIVPEDFQGLLNLPAKTAE